jgi:hypothetical protein
MGEEAAGAVSTRRVARFLGLALVALALLLAAWPLAPFVRTGYRAVFVAGATALSVPLRGHWAVRYERNTPGHEHDTAMVLLERGKRGYEDRVRLTFSSYLTGYIPTAVLVALFLALPAPWKRRLRGLSVGLLVLHAYLYLRVALLFVRAHATELRRPGTAHEGVFAREGWLEAVDQVVAVVHVEPIRIILVLQGASISEGWS